MSGGINAPFGLSPYQALSGNGDITKIQSFAIDSTCPSIFAGDPVVMSQWDVNKGGAAGLVGVAGTILPLSSLAGNSMTNAKILGYLVSVEYTSPNNIYSTKFPYWQAGTVVQANTPIVAYINVDPNVILQVQVSTSTDDFNQAIFKVNCINANASLKTGGANIVNNIPAGFVFNQNPAAGNANIGQSVYYLDNSSFSVATNNNATTPYNFKVMGIVPNQNLGTVGIQSATSATYLSNTTPGVDMPFITVYGKINNHVYSAPTASNTVTA